MGFETTVHMAPLSFSHSHCQQSRVNGRNLFPLSLQKEIDTLQARMSALEAKEQRLSQELEEQEMLLRWQGCDLVALVAQLSPGQLQEVSKALGETLTSTNQAPFHAEPPESLRRYW